MNKISAVVFDMDGVLFDTERMYLEAWKILGAEKNIKNIEETAKKCIGLSVTDTVALLLSTYGEDFPVEENHRLINEMVRERIGRDGMPVKTGAREILEYLYERRFTVGLASSTKYEKILDLLENAGLRKYFSVIVGGDMIAHSKPDPEIYRVACRELGASPENTAAIEDSRNGIISAYRAGLMPIMVPDLVEPTEELLSMTVGKFDSLLDVCEFFKEQNI